MKNSKFKAAGITCGMVAALLGLLLGLTQARPVQAATINVSPGQSIQTAVQSARAGDLIIVAAGTYNESVNLSQMTVIGDLTIVANGVVTMGGSGPKFYNAGSYGGRFTLDGFTLSSSNDDAIRLNDFTGLLLANSQINNTGNDSGDHALELSETSGAADIVLYNNTFTLGTGVSGALAYVNAADTVHFTLTAVDNQFTGATTGATKGIELFTSGSAASTIDATIHNNTFNNMDQAGLAVVLGGSAAVKAYITDNAFNTSTTALAQIDINISASAAVTTTIQGNTISGTQGDGIAITDSGDDANGTLTAAIVNNTLTTIGDGIGQDVGIRYWMRSGTLTSNLLIANNNISDITASGVKLYSANSTTDVTIDTNTITNANAVGRSNHAGIYAESDGGTLTLNLNNNSVSGGSANIKLVNTFGTFDSAASGNTPAPTTTGTIGAAAPLTPPSAVTPPNAADDAPTALTGVAKTLNILGNDTAATTRHYFTAVSRKGGTITNIDGSQVRYTSAANFTGADVFYYTIRDTNDATDIAVVSINVTALPTIAFSQATYQVNEDGTVVGAAVTLNRTGNLEGSSSVNVTFGGGTATGGGTDYTSTTQNISFASTESAKTVVVPINNDQIDENTENLTMTLASPTGATLGAQSSATLQILDDDTAAITVTPISGNTTELGGTAVFTVSLATKPTANVTLNLSSNDTSEGTVPPSITFTPTNWSTPQAVTVTGQNDAIVDGNVTYAIQLSVTSADTKYSVLTPGNVTVINEDDDGGVDINPTSELVTTEAGGTDTFDVVLQSAPTQPVTITLTSSDTSEGTVTPTSMLFTNANWNVAQTATVTGQNDTLADGNVAYSIQTAVISSDTAYASVNPDDVSVTNQDNEVASITVSAVTTNTTEAGGTATFTVVLDVQPASSVTIGLSSSDTTEGTVSPSSLTFNTGNWNTPQTVTITGKDDNLDDGDIAYSIVTATAISSDGYSGVNAADANVINLDNDTAGMQLVGTNLVASESGNSATFTVTLNTIPSDVVTVDLTNNLPAECTVTPSTLTLSATNWNTGAVATVSAVNDNLDDGDKTCTITTLPSASNDTAYRGINLPDVSVIAQDDDGAPSVFFTGIGYSVSEAAGSTSVGVRLSNMAPYTVTVSVASTDDTAIAGQDYTAVNETVTFSPMSLNSSFTVSVNDNAIFEGTKSLTLTLSSPVSATLGTPNAVALRILDNDNPPSLSISDSSTIEGDSGTTTLTFTVTQNMTYALPVTVTYATADGSATTADGDYNANTGTLTIPAGQTSGTLSVVVNGDTAVESDEVFFVNLSNPINAMISDGQGDGHIVNDDIPVSYPLFVPLAMRNFFYAPDLVIDTLVVRPNTIEVTIRNAGTAPVLDAFWVDVYINPSQPITAVNELWQDVSPQGAVWGVDSLPLNPGASVTLTLNDSFFAAELSHFPGGLAVGTPVYAQVDSAHTGNQIGAVLETHEINGHTYNNIIGALSQP